MTGRPGLEATRQGLSLGGGTPSPLCKAKVVSLGHHFPPLATACTCPAVAQTLRHRSLQLPGLAAHLPLLRLGGPRLLLGPSHGPWMPEMGESGWVSCVIPGGWLSASWTALTPLLVSPAPSPRVSGICVIPAAMQESPGPCPSSRLSVCLSPCEQKGFKMMRLFMSYSLIFVSRNPL